MHLRNLRYFCAAFETRSTVGAARQCHVTQPVISTAIAQLEEELGTRLFTRQQRGLQPTAAGQRLFRLGGKLLADAHAIVESFQDRGSRPQLSLRIHPALSLAHVAQLLRHLRRELAQLEVTVLGDEGRAAEGPAQSAADASLTVESCAPAGRTFMPLWEECYVLAVPVDHPLAVQETVTLQDLHGTAFIDRTHCELAAHWHAGLNARHIVPDVRARVHNEEWALGLVAAGLGVTIVPVHHVSVRDDVVVRRDVPELQAATRRVGLAYSGTALGTLADVLRVCEPWSPAGLMAVPG
ncbi:LysR family transcriptional regulator [Aquabacterium sp. A7-Y]|uniref:LysR family transcriptional regulator n=1 Tax=Aquabacterium sp. A7-Y TaxID=1349605 RepID=UPI00223CABA9|nr:LysR family transcriptional regulator [Aquabacterium sp. A7-Y]MCW7539682.1 LysR family transcriptional regulator [Aquabacterium sp. A7-Y]